MNYFLNFVYGNISINTYRKSEAVVTDVPDIRDAYLNDREENLTADLTGWIKEFGGDLENDELENLIELNLDLKMYDYPELRDIQREANETE